MSGSFESVYKILDGSMQGCLGASCPNSCCGEKPFVDRSGKTHMYRTSFMNDPFGETHYQSELESLDPQLLNLGVSIQNVISTKGGVVTLVNGCLDPETGCKLEQIGRKPLNCRAYPFAIQNPGFADKQCPAHEDIKRNAEESGLPKLLEEVDRAIGFTMKTLIAQFSKQ